MAEVDTPILDRAVAGDSAAIAFLLQIHEPHLLGHIRRRLPQRLESIAAVEDISQDVCFEACRLIGSFEPRGENSFIRWLQVIANRRILALLRQQRARRTYAASTDDDTLNALERLAVQRRSPSASAAAHEFAQMVERSISRLIPDYQTVLTLRFLNGFSVEETASRMDRTHESVYVLCSRAIKSLRAQLVSASRWQ